MRTHLAPGWLSFNPKAPRITALPEETRTMFASLLKSVVRAGSLQLTDASGRIHMVGDGTMPRVAIRLHSSRIAYSLAANPSLALGEAYMDNLLTLEEGTIYSFLEILARN